MIVHDELDLPVGRLKVKVGGGLAGNKGLQSIKAHLHTDGFVRVRIGVGKPPGRQEGANHVLRRPGKRERTELDTTIEEAADAVELIVAEGPEPRDDHGSTDTLVRVNLAGFGIGPGAVHSGVLRSGFFGAGSVGGVANAGSPVKSRQSSRLSACASRSVSAGRLNFVSRKLRIDVWSCTTCDT